MGSDRPKTAPTPRRGDRPSGPCQPPHILLREERPHPADPTLRQDRLTCQTHGGGVVGGWDWTTFDPETKAG